MTDLTYDVRVRGVERRRGVKGTITSYRLAWRVEERLWKATFSTKAQADAFRAELLTAARNGEPFLVETGRPLAWAPRAELMTWYEFTLAYTDAKWPHISPNHRRGIAEALTDATEAVLTRANGPASGELRAALRWSYSNRIRDDADPPAAIQAAVAWLATHTVRMDKFKERTTGASLARAMLTRISQTMQGTRAAANTANRKRMVLNNAMGYACEIGLLTDNPLHYVKWTRPRTKTAVDPRVVINTDQAHRFLAAVESHSPRGRRLKAFFGCMYYAGLRPEEATELRRSNLSLPDEPGKWGEMRLSDAGPRSGGRWTNTGEVRELVPLKHRARGDTRRVPVHPELVTLLKSHLENFGPESSDARLFVGVYGGPVSDRTYLKVFHESRAAAFTDAEAASPLMEVPYSLRHAAVSTWLRTTGDAALVARWAGHSVAVLLTVYAKCIHGAEEETLQRIWIATRRGPSEASPGTK